MTNKTSVKIFRQHIIDADGELHTALVCNCPKCGSVMYDSYVFDPFYGVVPLIDGEEIILKKSWDITCEECYKVHKMQAGKHHVPFITKILVT